MCFNIDILLFSAQEVNISESSFPLTRLAFLQCSKNHAVRWCSLHSTDCRETKNVNYGDTLQFNVTQKPGLLMFYPANGSASKAIELWSSNRPWGDVWCHPDFARWDCRCQPHDHECPWYVMARNDTTSMPPSWPKNREGEIWSFWNERATKKDKGMYVVGQESGRLMYKFQVLVEGNVMSVF